MDEHTPRENRADTPSSEQPPMPPFSPQTFDTGGGWGEKGSGWFRENASSVILPIVALLVLGGGVYFYTRGRQASERPIVEFQESTPSASPVEETSPSPSAITSPHPTAAPSPGRKITLSPEGKPVLGGPEPRLEGGMIRVEAQRGDGITHLARRAVQDYLKRKNPDFEVTKEQKIYIEDALKDAEIAKRKSGLNVGDELSFSEDAIRQATEQARTLTSGQLENLKQFSARVSQL